MFRRLINLFKFRIERLFLRGAHYRLLVIALSIGLISVVAGFVVYRTGHDFARPGQAVWWAFLRLTDPGYLGDDEGTLKRTVSTIVTILGYVVFLGALIAIMTQWLNKTIETLESGQTPVAHNGHVLILGWTNRTATIVRELMESSERLRRFLQQHGQRRLHLVVLAEGKASLVTQELREQVGSAWDERRITVRTGSSLRMAHLERGDFSNASVIVIPGSDFAEDGALQSDARVIKVLLAVSGFLKRVGKRPPLMVAEIFDARKETLARRAYHGDVEIVASRAMIARLIAQCILNPGMSRVHQEILTRSGTARVFVRERPEVAGAWFEDVAQSYEQAVVLGVVRSVEGSWVSKLHPRSDMRLEASDRLILLAADRQATDPDRAPRERAEGETPVEAPRPSRAPPSQRLRRVLVLGYSRKLTAMIHELERYEDERFEVVVVSRMSQKKRQARLERGLTTGRVTVRQVEADFTLTSEIAALEPAKFDSVVVVASDWWGTPDGADARSIVGCMVLFEVLAEVSSKPKVVVELLDPENASLVRELCDDLIVSPLLLSYQLAQIALRRELGLVFDELFGPGGAEVTSREPADYDLAGQVTFGEIEAAARRHGELAIGYRVPASADADGISLVPAQDANVDVSGDTQLLVIIRRANGD